MDFQYIGYTEDKKLVKGTLGALSQEMATDSLARRGYQVLSLKPVPNFMPSWDKLFPSLFQVKHKSLHQYLSLPLQLNMNQLALHVKEEQTYTLCT